MTIGVSSGQSGAVAALVREENGVVEVEHEKLVQAQIPESALTALEASPAVRYIREPIRPEVDVTSEGLSNMNVSTVHGQEVTGENVTVAVIDVQGFNLTNPEIGDNVVQFRNYTSPIGNGTTEQHGTATAELVVDTAPNASVVAVRVDTYANLLDAIDWIDTETDVDVVSMSLSWFGIGPMDGNTELSQEIGELRANGTVWFNSAGNYANEQHWNGTWQDGDDDDLVNFSSNDETLQIDTASTNVAIYMAWEDASNDYDLHLLDATGTNVLASSTNNQDGGYPAPVESITDSGETTYQLVIERVAADGNADFDIFFVEQGHAGDSLEYWTAERSITNPGVSPHTITIGATYYDNNQLETFSSRGPTVDGRLGVDLVAPDGVNTSTYSGAFFGTSASTPHAAGVAALVLDADGTQSPTQIETNLKSSTTSLSGTEPDREFGYGLVNATGGVESIGTVSNCQVIDSPGEYVLDQNLSGPFSAGVCLYVSSSDVTIDGQGHTIDGVDGTGRAVFVEGPSAANPVANVTVTNVTVVNADLGVAYQNVTGSTVQGVIARNQTRIGIGASGTSDITFENITATGNEWGAHYEFSSDVSIAGGSNLSANNDTGLNLIQTTNATVTASNITANNNNGIWADGSTNVSVTGNNVFANGNTGVHLPSVTGGMVAANEISDNLVGVRADGSTNVTVEDNVVTGSGDRSIYVTNSPQVAVSNNVVESSSNWGIEIQHSEMTNVTGNQLDGNAGGVQLLESDNGTLSDNVINGSGAPGISIESSIGTLAINNTVTHTGSSAIQLGGTTSDATVAGNNASTNGDIGINLFGGDQILVTDNEISGNDNVGIAAGGPTNVTIENNTVEANTLGGLTSTHGQTLTVRNNTISANHGVGVYIENISDATLTENVVTGTTSGGIGIEVNASSQAIVSNNVVDSSDNWGIMVTRSDQSEVAQNELEANGGGVRLFDSADSTVTNNVANDTALGLLVENATGTDVTDNTLTNNQFDGLQVANGSGNILRNNTATGNNVGLGLQTTETVTAENNNLSANGVGALLDGTTAVTFADTQATDNTNAALHAVNGSTVASASNFTLTGGDSVAFSARDVSFAVDQTPPAIPSGTDQTGPFIEAVNNSADGWIEFTLDYDESTLSSTVEESTLRLWRYDGTWSNDIGGTNTVDTANDTVTANVTTFSTFTLLAEEVPEANVTPSALDFGDVNLADTPLTLDVTVANDGAAALNVTDVSIFNDTDGEFTVTSGGGSQIVQPGDTATVTVEFAPSDTGAESATLSISHNDTDASPSNVSLAGAGVAPNASVSPTAIDYGNVSVGTSVTEDVTVTNDGSAALNVTAVSVANDTDGDFAVTAGASQVVQPGDTGTVTVEFSPGATGAMSATLVVEHNDTDATPSNVSLAGAGVAPNISVMPSSMEFGEVHVNTTETRDVTVTNDGSASLNVSDATVSGSTELAVNASFAPFVLVPGDSRNVSVDFAPTTTGEETATLAIENNATNATGSPVGPIEIDVNGTGVGPNASITPGSIDFGDVSVSGSASADVTIENDGNASLEVSGVSIGGADDAEFSVTAGGSATTVPPGDTQTVTVEFAPVSPGAKSALLNVSHNASSVPTSVALSGTGIAPSAAVTPSAVDYGDVHTNATANETVTVENDGTAPLNMTSLDVQGDAAFALVVGSPTVLQPGDTQSVIVQFAPATTGTSSATLVVQHNASGSPANVSLDGRGVAPDVAATPAAAVEFGDVNVSAAANESVVIENNGTAPLDLTGASITGANASRFSVAADPTPAILSPGGTETVVVQFSPVALGDQTAFLNVTHNASRPAVNLTLNGTGIDAEPPAFDAAAAANATDGSTLFGRNDTVTVNATVADNLDADLNVTVDASVLGNGTVTLTDDDADGTYNRSIAIDAANAMDGIHQLSVTATDSQGNANTTQTNEITVDTTNATLDITAPANGTVTDRTWVAINATAADAPAGVDRVQVNDGGWTDASLEGGTWTYNVTGLADGVHTFEVRAIDNASNVGPVATVTVTVDTTPPVIETAVLDRTADIPPEAPLGVAVNATDATSGVQSASASAVSLTQSATWWNGTVTAAPTIGNRTLSVTVLDRAGNANTTVLEYRVGVEAPLSDDNGTLTAAPTDPTVRNVTIIVNGTIGNETVFVGTSQSNPEPVDPPDDVTLYFPQINVSVANANITDATMTVQVTKSRVDATNADLDTVAFWVFESGTWNATTGTLVAEDATHLTYEIEAPHFSTYAITADTVTTAGGGGAPGGDTGGDTGGDVPVAPSLSTSVSRLADGTVRLTVENTVVGETSTLAIEGGLVANAATFDSIDLTYAQDGERLEVDFRPDDSRPADVPELEQAVTMGYLTADTGVPDRTLDAVVFHFSVDESALPEGAGLDDVALYRYDGSQWTELETTRQDGAFRATSPGFSVFAVGAATTDISVTAADLAVADLVVGETAEVTVTLENDGTAQGSYTVDVLANDVTVATTEATVPAGGTETVTLSWTLESPGEYEVVVDAESAGTLVVEEAADTGEPPTETPVAEGEEAATSEPPAGTPGGGAPPTDLPGIALVALLVVLVVVGLYVYRERTG